MECSCSASDGCIIAVVYLSYFLVRADRRSLSFVHYARSLTLFCRRTYGNGHLYIPKSGKSRFSFIFSLYHHFLQDNTNRAPSHLTQSLLFSSPLLSTSSFSYSPIISVYPQIYDGYSRYMPMAADTCMLPSDRT